MPTTKPTDGELKGRRYLDQLEKTLAIPTLPGGSPLKSNGCSLGVIKVDVGIVSAFLLFSLMPEESLLAWEGSLESAHLPEYGGRLARLRHSCL